MKIASALILVHSLLLSPKATFADGKAHGTPPLLTAAFIPLTGSAAEQGDWIRRGLELGREQARAKYGVTVNLRVEDTAADPKTAMSAYQSLHAREDFKVAFTSG